MSKELKVRLYATCELRLHVDTEIDLDEYVEWVEASGEVFDPEDIDADSIVEFIKASPDDEWEMNARFPDPSALHHEVLSQLPTPNAAIHEVEACDIVEAEVL